MSIMKKKVLQPLIDQEDQFRFEVERDSYKGQLAVLCSMELVGHYIGTDFIKEKTSDNAQWHIDSLRRAFM